MLSTMVGKRNSPIGRCWQQRDAQVKMIMKMTMKMMMMKIIKMMQIMKMRRNLKGVLLAEGCSAQLLA